MKLRFLFTSLLSFTLLACSHNHPQFSGSTEGERLNQFFEWVFLESINKMPQQMAYLGIPKKQDQLNDYSEEFSKKGLEDTKKYLAILESFDRDKLNSKDQLSYDLFRKQAQQRIDNYQWKEYGYPVNQMFGVQSGLPNFMMNIHKIKNEQDARNYIARLSQFKRVFSEVINSMMRSELAGVVPPKFVFPLVIRDSRNIITGKPFTQSKKDSPLALDFKTKVKKLKLSKEKEKALIAQMEKQLMESVKPSYDNLITFLNKQEKRANTQAGAWKFPRGDEFYKSRLKYMTTTDYSAEKIHQMGLDNVKRIRKEMDDIRKKVKFKGDLKAFFKYTRSKKFILPDTEKGKKKYIKMANKFISTMKKDLDRLFLTKPKADIVVKPVEKFREKSAGLAFYQSPALDGSRPGTYYVNTGDMRGLPIWEAEALAYHEGIPGHHMQNSISQELTNMPKFRKLNHIVAYGEGWGLYTERLPKEYGYYKDPYSDFGRLSMELTRALRLVVDTGLHHKKWSREKAIQFLDDHSPRHHEEHVKNINRYIVMPGQATGYMVGMLKILELRAKAKKELGKKFDIRKFHDVILTSGPVPLDVLETMIDDYIKAS